MSSKTLTIEMYTGFSNTKVGDIIHYDGDDYQVVKTKPTTSGNTKVTMTKTE